MAGGWARDGAVQDQIDRTDDDAVERARARLPSGPGRQECRECGDTIPQARRDAIPPDTNKGTSECKSGPPPR